jgi:hypothetical protein
MKVRAVGAELFNVDGQTGRLDEADSRFSEFFRTRLRVALLHHRKG